MTRRVVSIGLALWVSAGCAGSAGTAPGAESLPTVTSEELASRQAPAAPSQQSEASAAALTEQAAVYAPLVAAADRSEADRALDEGRKPAETLAFMQVQPGMRVAEIASGGGYTAELLARAVGPTGAVYGVNSQFVLDRFAEGPWSERLQLPVMTQVTRLDREFDDPFPDDLVNLDLVVNVLFYHDTYWMGLDRAAMNQAVFDALRPGGRYVVIDHAAGDVMSESETKSLHRVGEQRVRTEIEQAGFQFAGSADFLRNPDDAHDWSASPSRAAGRRGTSDRFALVFVKPQG